MRRYRRKPAIMRLEERLKAIRESQRFEEMIQTTLCGECFPYMRGLQNKILARRTMQGAPNDCASHPRAAGSSGAPCIRHRRPENEIPFPVSW